MARGDKKKPTLGKRANGNGPDDEAPYDVGRNKPPVHSRWPKGRSGNPNGRPRKTNTVTFATKISPVRDMILEEMGRPVSVKEGGETIEMETLRAIVRKVNIGAMTGNRIQQRLALQYATSAQDARKLEVETGIRSALTHKQRWDGVFEEARLAGRPEPTELPHPNHVNIDPNTGEISVSGPLVCEEKAAWDLLKFRMRETERLLLAAQCKAAAKRPSRHDQETIKLMQEHLRRLEQNVPKGWDWREMLGWEDAYAKRFYAKLKLPPSPDEEQ